jgi:hypothetical protein
MPSPSDPSRENDAIVESLKRSAAEKSLSEKSVGTYVASLRRAAGAIGEPSYRRILRAPEVSMEAMSGKFDNDNTLKTTAMSLVSVLGHVEGLISTSSEDFERLKARWTREVEPVRARVLESNESSVRRGSDVNWADVVAKNESLVKLSRARPASARAQMDALLSSIYCDMPPRRQSDYAMVRIYRTADEVPEEEPGAFVVMDRRRLRINEFKTSKKLGSYEAEMHPTTFAALERSLRVQPRDQVFPFKTVNAFTKHHNTSLKKWFGDDRVSNNTIRRARAAALIGDATLSSHYKKEFAIKMGHSIKTNMDYAFTPVVNPDGTFDTTRVDPTTGEVIEYTCVPKKKALA